MFKFYAALPALPIPLAQSRSPTEGMRRRALHFYNLIMQIKWVPYPWVCFSMCVGVMGTALASPLYPLYQAAWQLQTSDITLVYAIYMAGALLSLLTLGSLSDRYGFVRVLRLGLILVTAGSLLSACAWNYTSFAVARFLVGMASGMITTSASIGLTQLNNRGDLQHAAAITSLTIAFGFGLGPILGGLMAQWAPHPLLTAYLPPLVLGVLAIVALGQVGRQIPRPAADAASPAASWLPQITLPAAPLRHRYLLASMCAFLAFGMFSLFASLAPSFMATMVPWHGPAVSGLALGLILLLSAGFQFLARSMTSRWCALAGLSALGISLLVLLLNTWLNSSLLFVLSVLGTALGHGLCNIGGMSLVNRVADDRNRSGLIATYLVIGYIGSMLPIMVLGWMADHLSLATALPLYCGAMSALIAWVLWSIFRLPSPPLPGNAQAAA